MGFEDTALDQDAAVTEVASLALLVEFKQKLGQVARHLHDETSGGSARREEEFKKTKNNTSGKWKCSHVDLN